MALRATIYKVELHVADNDRAYYGSHAVTVARHPSETDERLMVRLLAYALWIEADERLAFTRGLSDADEPALWNLDLTGAVRQWVEVGLPDERRLLKACGPGRSGRRSGLWPGRRTCGGPGSPRQAGPGGQSAGLGLGRRGHARAGGPGRARREF